MPKAYPNALNGLVEKFGSPSSTKTDKTQNMMGAQFDHVVNVWLNPLSSIYLESPWSKIDNMYLKYTEVRLSEIVETQRRQDKGSDASKI